MSLVSKIFAAFVVMIAIAVCAGVMGWNTVSRMDGMLARIVEFEIDAETNLADIEQAAQSLTVAQRTLLNTDIAGADREEQHATMLAEKDAMLAAVAKLDAVFAEGASEVDGWDAIRGEWQTIRTEIATWMQAVDDNDALLRAYEATTILAPDLLLQNLAGYRGDHFQTATLLGEMIAREESLGAKINPADNLCAFGKWRERFDSGLEPYSKNPQITEALKGMTAPHRAFHASAAQLQELIAGGYRKNKTEAAAVFAAHVEAARAVVGQFQLIAAEVERSRGLLRQATDFTMGEMREMRQESIEALNALVAANTANMDKNVAAAVGEADTGVRTMQTLAAAALGVGIVVMVWLFIAVRRGLSRPLTRIISALSEESDKMSGGAREVESSSASLSEGASSQSSALEETSAAVEEITSMARKNLENSKNANSEMRSASVQIQASSQDMELMGTAMEEIKESSEKISNILRTIEEIAFQTNLLALNAAVEAARAGEAGKGFAVVADEVRNLAGRSAQAVKDTSELITGTVSRINNGDAITRRIRDQFDGITASAGRVAKMIEEIDSATSEQTLGMEQINTAVAQIDQINQRTAGNAETNAAVSGSLNQISGALTDHIGDLSQMLRTIIGSGAVKNMGEHKEEPRQLGNSGAKKRQLALPAPKN